MADSFVRLEADMKQTILTLKNIDFSYHSLNGETKALDNVSFTIEAGEFVAIVGPSGCGNAMDRKRKL